MSLRSLLCRTQLVIAGAGLLLQAGCADLTATDPTGASAVSAAGSLMSRAPGQPGSPPLLVWTPGDPTDGFDFGEAVAGQTTTQEFTLANAGGSASGALTIGWAGAASFRVTRDDCGRASLPPGKSCTVSVEFDPQVIGHEQSALLASGQRREAHARLELHGKGAQSRLQEEIEPWLIVEGQGKFWSPYMKVCDWYDNSSGDCVVVFPWRTLAGLTSEPVPAYSCPHSGRLINFLRVPGATLENTNYQWLINTSYAPFGTTIPNGVAVDGLGWVGITIHRALLSDLSAPPAGMAIGTEPIESSVTNWNTAPRSYRIALHCVRQVERGYDASR